MKEREIVIFFFFFSQLIPISFLFLEVGGLGLNSLSLHLHTVPILRLILFCSHHLFIPLPAHFVLGSLTQKTSMGILRDDYNKPRETPLTKGAPPPKFT